jgi:PEP-CTERM motif
MQNPFLRAVLATAALCTALPSHADGNHQALISNVKIKLVDLDASDGITPAITFADGGFIATWISAPGASEDRIQIDFALGTAASATRTAGSHSVTFAILAGDLLGAGSGPGAVASHSGAGAGGVAGEGQVLFTDFTLTPNTRIEISASAAASTAGYVGAGGSFDAWAGAGVNLFSHPLQTSLSFDFINAYSNALGQGPSTEARELFAAYDNRADTPFAASISAVAYLGASEAAAVPEPASWAMLAAGLTAWALRRRGTAGG